jgi:hypothetical protein
VIALASGLRVYTGLAMMVQQTLDEDPFGGAVLPFAGAAPG